MAEAPDTSPIRVRPARLADARAIGRVSVAAWRDAYPTLLPAPVLTGLSPGRQAAFWRRNIARSQGEAILVAEGPGGDVVGFGSAGRNRTRSLPFAGEVYTLYVDPDYQGHGIGGALVRGLFTALIRRGMTSAVIWVLARNGARFFYHACGGRPVAERRELLWGTEVDQVAYAWPDLNRAVPGAGVRRQ